MFLRRYVHDVVHLLCSFRGCFFAKLRAVVVHSAVQPCIIYRSLTLSVVQW